MNPAKLDRELRANGIPIHGCDSGGGIQFMDEATSEQRDLAAQILADFDAVKADADEAREKLELAAIDIEQKRAAAERLGLTAAKDRLAAELVAALEKLP